MIMATTIMLGKMTDGADGPKNADGLAVYDNDDGHDNHDDSGVEN